MATGDLAKGFALGLGAAVAVPVVLISIAAGAPPIRRALGRTGLIVTEKLREGTAEVVEVVDDLVAEVQEHRSAAQRPPAEVVKAESKPAEKTAAKQSPRRTTARKKTRRASGKTA